MNIKRFTLLTAACLTAVGGVFLLNESPKESYFPRATDAFKEKAKLHAGYAEYLASLRNNRTTGYVSTQEVTKAVQQATKLKKSNKALNVNWRFKGPDNVGGRTRALLIDVMDTTHIIAASVSGGIWESTNSAVNWQPYDTDFKINNVSCMAQSSDGTIYVGTGSSFDGRNNNKALGSEFVGSGVYKLTGNGTSELLVGPVVDLNYNVEWAIVDRLAVDPNDPQRIFAAMNRGLRESTDGGQTWSNPIGTTAPCQDVDISSDGKIVASFAGSIYVSTDNGQTYNSTFFSGARRIETAIAPTNSNVFFASMADVSSRLLNAYRSSDAGVTWEILQNPPRSPDYLSNSIQGQGVYNNTVAVSPTTERRVIFGGVNMFEWRQSSIDPAPLQGEWRAIASTNEFTGNGRNPYYVHADIHAFVFHPSNPNKLYIGSDGGVGYSENMTTRFPTFSINNLGYNVTQFYDIGIGKNDLVVGGTQDNGTQLIGLDFNTGKSAIEVLGGDGFEAELFAINPELGIASLYFGSIFRLQGVGTTVNNSNFNVASVYSGTLASICGAGRFGGCSDPFYTTVAKWESFNDPNTNDSVTVTLSRAGSLPPIPVGTVIPYNSKNNDWPLADTVRTPLFPVDTSFEEPRFLDTINLAISKTGTVTFANAFDTITVDNTNQTMTLNLRDQSQLDVRNFTYGIPEEYENVFYDPNDALSYPPLSVTVSADSSTVTYVDPQIEFKYEIDFADSVQTMVALLNVRGRVLSGRRNIWLTKDLLKGADVNEPRWIQLTDSSQSSRSLPTTARSNDDALCATFSNDGNSLFYGTEGGFLYRLDNLHDIDLSQVPISVADGFFVDSIISHNMIRNFGNRAITGIAVDPNNSNNVIVTMGNYGQAQYVNRSTDALSNSPTFVNISGAGADALPTAPAYEAVIDFRDNNKVLVATELGVFGTENAFTSDPNNVVWTEENTNLGRSPVHAIKQMVFGSDVGATNQGRIYIGTHGRGIFESDLLVGLDDIAGSGSNPSEQNQLKIYPNPTVDNLNLELRLFSSENVNIQIFAINGQMVRELNYTNASIGKNTVNFDVSDLERGTYIVRTIQNNSATTSKFIKR